MHLNLKHKTRQKAKICYNIDKFFFGEWCLPLFDYVQEYLL